MLTKPTPYDDVNATLRELHRQVVGILGDRLTGMYLYGSLAVGDFHPESSDVDVFLLTDGALTDKLVIELRTMHVMLQATATRILEAVYVPEDVVRRGRRWEPVPEVHEDGLHVSPLGADLTLILGVLRDRGIRLTGTDITELAAPVEPADVRRASAALAIEWWQPQLATPERFQHLPYLAYAVLTMCRVRYALEFGQVVSKPAAARWVLANCDRKDAALVAKAMTWPPEVALEDALAALAFIHQTIGYAERTL